MSSGLDAGHQSSRAQGTQTGFAVPLWYQCPAPHFMTAVPSVRPMEAIKIPVMTSNRVAIIAEDGVGRRGWYRRYRDRQKVERGKVSPLLTWLLLVTSSPSWRLAFLLERSPVQISSWQVEWAWPAGVPAGFIYWWNVFFQWVLLYSFYVFS